MMKMELQFFAHKKGVGSTKNGRDSESKSQLINHCFQLFLCHGGE